MIGTYPKVMIENLEKEIAGLKLVVIAQERIIRKWGLAYELPDLPLDIREKYIRDKVRSSGDRVEGEGPMGYYGDV